MTTTHDEARRPMWRSRWAAIGAAIAVTLGGGGIALVGATSAPSSFVAITPVRILDTRADLGLAGVLTSPTGRLLQVTGSVPTPGGQTTVVPSGATAVSLNVTAVGPTAPGFLSIRPGGTPGAPTTSNLNFDAGAVIPNAVTVELPSNGSIDIVYSAFGAVGPTTDVLVDVTGYFVAGSGSPGPAGPVGPTGPTGPAGQRGQRGPGTWDTIPSGVTVTGYQDWDFMSTGPDGAFLFSVPLPGKAPVPLNSNQINFAASSGGSPFILNGDSTCTGTPAQPTAPPGKVCLYLVSFDKVTGLYGTRNLELANAGFTVGWSGDAAGANQGTWVTLTWAYTAP